MVRSCRIVGEDGVFESVRETPNSSVDDVLRFSSFLYDVLWPTELNESIDSVDTVDGLVGERDGDPEEVDEFERYHPLYVDGYLAHILFVGSPDTSFDGTHAEAKTLGRQFERAVIADRYGSFVAWRLDGPRWSTWFGGVRHWDETLVLADVTERGVWLFAFTTTDRERPTLRVAGPRSD